MYAYVCVHACACQLHFVVQASNKAISALLPSGGCACDCSHVLVSHNQSSRNREFLGVTQVWMTRTLCPSEAMEAAFAMAEIASLRPWSAPLCCRTTCKDTREAHATPPRPVFDLDIKRGKKAYATNGVENA
jgi:hypothetical protein